ncbi:hypothetical protein B0H19DRAFT_1055941 [Mycena capillaripes]|nr:hypothetical protein B0H19DRAFT_1055941 [Mycena capillaripes]
MIPRTSENDLFLSSTSASPELKVPYDIKTYKRDSKTGIAAPELKVIHPLGKSPVITVGDYAIAESALHFGPSLIPTKWKPGCEGKVGGETEEYMRYRYYMHYCEGSLMSLLVVLMLSNMLNEHSPNLAQTSKLLPFLSSSAPYSQISGKINKSYIDPNFVTHFNFLEEQLSSAPNGGPYDDEFPCYCGDKRTGRPWYEQETYPKLFAYAELLKKSESYKRAVDKIVALEGKYTLI